MLGEVDLAKVAMTSEKFGLVQLTVATFRAAASADADWRQRVHHWCQRRLVVDNLLPFSFSLVIFFLLQVLCQNNTDGNW